MKTLNGVLKSTEIDLVNSKTPLRFKNKNDFITPEALIIYEQGMMDSDKLLSLCSEEYDLELSTPKRFHIPSNYIVKFINQWCVPLKHDVQSNTMYVGVIPEKKDTHIICDNLIIVKVLIPIYYYVSLYTKYYGEPDFLCELPVLDKLDFIVSEAISKEAAEITISNVASGGRAYYNVRKRKVHSLRSIADKDVLELAKFLASGANASIDETKRVPRYFSVKLDEHNRGRVTINCTYYGHAITVRILPNELLTKSLEDLNIKPKTRTFIRDVVLSREKGLRLFIGETMSGKNTSILSALLELVATDKYKIVSLEQPVELLVDGIEQIDCETDEEFELNADSLLRQNPDIVYFTEITSRTAESIIRQSNTSKAIYSSIHANTISDVIPRLHDITGMSIDRLVMTLHSCVYQELVRDDAKDEIYPVNRCLYFSDDLKSRLYGKTMAEMKLILQEEENKWTE